MSQFPVKRSRAMIFVVNSLSHLKKYQNQLEKNLGSFLPVFNLEEEEEKKMNEWKNEWMTSPELT